MSKLHFVGALERNLFLRKLQLLRELGPRELAMLAEHARERFVRRGERILEPGERVREFFIVVDGTVRVVGGEHPVAVELGPEQAIGFLAVLARDEAGVEATATTDALLLEFDEELLLDLLEENYYVVSLIIRALGRQILAERKGIAAGTHLGGVEPVLEIPPDRPLSHVERLLVLRRGAMGQGNLDALGRFARQILEERHPTGTRLWSFGDRSGYTSVLLAGRVRCEQPGGRGTFTCGPGYPLGNVESQCGEPRWYDAWAESDVVLLKGVTEAFHDALEDDFELAMVFVSSFAGRAIALRREGVLTAAAAS